MSISTNAIPLLMATGGDPLDEYGIIERSVRTRNAASASLTRTFGAGESKTFTFGCWLKGGDMVRGLFLLSNIVDPYNYDRFVVYPSGAIGGSGFFGSAPGTQMWTMTTNRLIRDPNAFYHIHFVYDSTQPIASNRLSLEVNGELITDFASIAYPALNRVSYINGARVHTLMAWTTNYSDGYIASPYFIDGVNIKSSYFGRTHTITGQWRPRSSGEIKAQVDLGGVNSFFLEFKDTSASTAAALGKDSSSKGNNWTPNNISISTGQTQDVVKDTPTTGYCVYNPVDSSVGSILNGLLTITGTGAAGYGSIPMSSGKWRAEYKYTAIGTAAVVIVLRSINSSNSVGYASNGNKNINGSYTAYGSTFTTNVVIGVVVDIDNNTIEFFRNGVSQGVINYNFSGQSWIFSNGVYGTNGADTLHVNFGQQDYIYPSVLADAQDLCYKNLPTKYPVVRASDAFIIKTDSGDNIRTVLESASSWDKWIRIYKRRDAAEGWRWQFWDDPDNCLDSSTNAAKIAFPSLTGSSYVGYALRVLNTNGISTGRLDHINGVPDTVLDGLSNSRKMIILKNEATGVWCVYHPDIAIGKLLYLEQTTGETVDASINTVTSSGFNVASTLASGTYRWIAISEIIGFIKLGRHAGNGSANGPFNLMNFSPALMLTKSPTAAGTNYEWYLFDNKRDTENPITGSDLELNSTNGEGVSKPSYAMDFISNGQKLRSYSEGINFTSAYAYVWLAIANSPSRYSNAK